MVSLPEGWSLSPPQNSLGSARPFADAIASIESAGSGDYNALGPLTKRGDRAYGRYQVMGANIPSWTQEALGKSLTPKEFLSDRNAQDAVFANKFGSYIKQYGNPQDAASAWFTGRPLAEGGNATDVLGTSGNKYVDKFNAALPAGAVPQQASAATLPKGWSLTPPTKPAATSQPGYDFGSDLLAAGKMAASYVLPSVNAGFEMGQDPSAALQGSKEHYGKYLSLSGLQDLATHHPLETATEIGGLLAGGKSIPEDVAASGSRVARDAEMAASNSALTEAGVRASGGAKMNAAKASEALVPGESLKAPVDELKKQLDEQGIVLDPKLHPVASNMMKRLEQVYKTKAAPPEAAMTGATATPPPPLSLKELHVLRQRAQDVVDAGVRPDGRINTEGKIGLMMKDAINQMIDLHPEGQLFKSGVSEVAKAEKAQLLTDALERAKQSASWQNGNHVAALRSQINPLILGKKNRNRWTPEERRILKAASNRGIAGLIGALGSHTVSGFAFGRIFESTLGLPPGILWPVGHFVKEAHNARRVAKVENLRQNILSGR